MLKSGITEEKRYMHMLVSNGKMAELHMKKNKLVRTLGMGFTAIAVAVSVSLSGIRSEAAPSYLKAATYVSDAWVSNFWNSESDHMDEELAQIAADGFNSIVLVVPWREFQPGVLPLSYNRYAFQKLDKVMNAARAHGLMVELRVGYVWDYYNDDVTTGRFRDLLKDSSTRAAWLAYAKQIYRTASAHSNFHGGFMTWEDFWNYIEDAGNLGRGANSRIAAKNCGYQAWLKKHYSLKQVNEYYQPKEVFTSYDNIYIPARKDYAFKLFYDFYDDFLNDLLEDTQKVFPGLSMEVRLDVDPVSAQDGNGETGASHYGTFQCGNAEYTSLMYSVSMGHGFGNVLSAEEAIKTMNEQLSLVRANNGGKPVFIDQLLYMDATEGFEPNCFIRAGATSALYCSFNLAICYLAPFLQFRTAVLAHADLLVALDLVSNAGTLVALGADNLHLAGGDGSLALDDAALLALTAGLDVAGDHVAAFHNDLALAGDGAQHLTLLAAVLAGQDDNGVILLDLQTIHFSGPSIK